MRTESTACGQGMTQEANVWCRNKSSFKKKPKMLRANPARLQAMKPRQGQKVYRN